MSNKELIERLKGNDVILVLSIRAQAADALEAADKRIAELEKEAQFNFEQYQDAGRLLCEANDKLAVARQALSVYACMSEAMSKPARKALAQIGEK